MSTWLKLDGRSAGNPLDLAQEKVAEAAGRLGEPKLAQVVAIFNGALSRTDLPDEYLWVAEKFIGLFRAEQIPLNPGVDSFDFVRECVRRSFSVSQVVDFTVGTAPNTSKERWVSDEQIGEIAAALVAWGFVLP